MSGTWSCPFRKAHNHVESMEGSACWAHLGLITRCLNELFVEGQMSQHFNALQEQGAKLEACIRVAQMTRSDKVSLAVKSGGPRWCRKVKQLFNVDAHDESKDDLQHSHLGMMQRKLGRQHLPSFLSQ